MTGFKTFKITTITRDGFKETDMIQARSEMCAMNIHAGNWMALYNEFKVAFMSSVNPSCTILQKGNKYLGTFFCEEVLPERKREIKIVYPTPDSLIKELAAIGWSKCILPDYFAHEDCVDNLIITDYKEDNPEEVLNYVYGLTGLPDDRYNELYEILKKYEEA